MHTTFNHKEYKTPYRKIASFLLLLFLLAACKSIKEGLFEKQTPHKAYWSQIEKAGLADSKMAKEWIKASDSVLITAVETDIPFSEAVVFDYDNLTAVAYHFSLQEGRSLRVVAEPELNDTSRVFIDLYRKDDELKHIGYAPEGSPELTHQVKRDGIYVVRIQPELLTRGLFNVQIYSGASLAFPLEGKDYSSIASFYGDPRDGGARRHEGVDVFSPRGTPVLAVAPGRVRRTGTNNLGGNVVWVSGSNNGYSYYYAHLDTQLVEPGTKVASGDTIGLVGNTGNARTTAPHLHFGIYAYGRGAVNPYPFFHHTETVENPPQLVQQFSGEWGFTSSARANLRESPAINAAIINSLPGKTPVRIKGVSGNWLRVDLPEGQQGFVHHSLVSLYPNDTPEQSSPVKKIVRNQPVADSPAVGLVNEEETFGILNHYGDYVLIRYSEQVGWIKEEGI